MTVPVVPLIVGCAALVALVAGGAAIYLAMREPERVPSHRSVDRSSPRRTQRRMRSPTSSLRRRSTNVSSCQSYEYCIICLTRPVNVELYPCGAQNLCSACVPRLYSEVMRNCPSCRCYITRFERM